MKLKKLMLVVAAAGLFTACSNTDDLNQDLAQNAPSTEVYMGVNALNILKKSIQPHVLPKIHFHP